MKTKITHFTNSSVNRNNIIESGRVELEGHNILTKPPKTLTPEEKDAKHSIELSVRIMGGYRFVWLTEEDSCGTTYSTSEEAFAFPFYAEDIKATKWTDFRKRLLGKKDSRELVVYLEKLATDEGDDWKKWWVTTKPISLKQCIELPPEWSA
tara:strand:+ start:107 stop:562 length:456 start_codon:yes stop_codon:yes gene_type:complete